MLSLPCYSTKYTSLEKSDHDNIDYRANKPELKYCQSFKHRSTRGMQQPQYLVHMHVMYP